jgi:hypothetical protein
MAAWSEERLRAAAQTKFTTGEFIRASARPGYAVIRRGRTGRWIIAYVNGEGAWPPVVIGATRATHRAGTDRVRFSMRNGDGVVLGGAWCEVDAGRAWEWVIDTPIVGVALAP